MLKVFILCLSTTYIGIVKWTPRNGRLRRMNGLTNSSARRSFFSLGRIMTIYFLLYFALFKSTCGQNCDWINAITKRRAHIKFEIIYFYGLGAGLHRVLTLDLELGNTNRFIDCSIAYKFTIPAGAYVDTDSVKEDRSHTFGRTAFNVEEPKEKSKSATLYVCSKRALRKTFVHSELLTLPIHLRYHAPTGKDAIVTMPAPQLLVKCTGNSSFLTSSCKRYLTKAPCDCSSNFRCEWLLMSLLEYNSVKFTVPTGDPSHLKIVLFGTFFTVISCTAAIIIASLKKTTKVKV